MIAMVRLTLVPNSSAKNVLSPIACRDRCQCNNTCKTQNHPPKPSVSLPNTYLDDLRRCSGYVNVATIHKMDVLGRAEGVLMVALRTMNIPPEAWQCVKFLGAIPNCKLVLMAAYHIVSPSLSTEEASLMSYLQSPPDAGPVINQAQVFRIGSVLGEDWCRLEEGYLQPTNSTNPPILRQNSE